MKIYSVGGSLRDEALNKKVNDYDYLVVGSSREEMIKKNFIEVGKSSFPVFLHPKTKDEYALAIYNEKKSITEHQIIKDDLLRRDITINTLVKDEDGNILDFFGAMKDIENKVIKHVSDKFREDPVRVLRVARLYCRYKELGFTIHENTLSLIKEMVAKGELNNLSPERVLIEIKKACKEDKPSIFFEKLREFNALKIIIPEVDALFGVEENKTHHPEGDSGTHTMMVIDSARKITDNPGVIIPALFHDLGKALTPKSLWPKHHNHEKNGVPLVENVCDRLKIDKKTKETSIAVCLNHLKIHNIFNLRAKTIIETIKSSKSLNSEEQMNFFISACESDFLGRDIEKGEYNQKNLFIHLVKSLKSYSSLSLRERGYTGKKLGEMIEQEKIKMIKNEISKFNIKQ